MITIIDYGAGNLRSVSNAIASLGYKAHISSDPDEIIRAQAIILPGVGAAADTMANLDERKLLDPIRKVIAAEVPFLGICMGCSSRAFSKAPNSLVINMGIRGI